MKICVLNLDRAARRWSLMAEQFRELGLTAERISAVDGRTLDIKYATPLIPGEIGCLLSHKKAWERIVASGDEYALILEDDVILSPDLPTLLADCSWLPSGPFLVKIDTWRQRVGYAKTAVTAPANRSLHLMLTRNMGGAGYIVSRQAAETLLDSISMDAPVDELLFGELPPAGIQRYQMVSAAVIQRQLAGDLTDTDTLTTELERIARQQRKPRPATAMLVAREILRPLKRFTRRIFPIVRFRLRWGNRAVFSIVPFA